MATPPTELRKMLLARRLREAIVHVELANKLLDDEYAACPVEDLPELTDEDLKLMAELVQKVNEMVAGYEDLLPQGV